MKRAANFLRVALALTVLTVASCEQLPAAESPQPSPLEGTWKWGFTMSDGSKVEPKAKIKRDGDTLKGTSITRPGFDAPLTNIVLQGDSVSWMVTREQDGRKVTTRYRGKIEDDTIKGKIESDWDGAIRSYDWEAKRAPNTPDGTWRWETVGLGGRSTEGKVKLKLEGDKVTGKLTVFGRETDVKEGVFKKGELSFTTVRERDGVKSVTSYRGKIDGDTIKGEVELEIFGEPRVFDWNPTRVDE